MAKVKVIARDIVVKINGGTSLVPEWTEIKGLNSVSFSSSKSDADTTTFDEGGWGSHIVVNRSRSASVEGLYLVDTETGDRDEGQALVDSYNEKIGPDSLAEFKIEFPGKMAKVFKASVNVSDIGGGNDDSMPWGAELTVSGKVVEEAVVGL